MGGHASKEARHLTPEEVSFMFAQKCAKQYSALEVWSLKKVVGDLADHEDGVAYWKEETFLKYYGIPDELGVGRLLFKSASTLAAFPFINSLAPAPLTADGFIKVLAFFDGKYKAVLKDSYNVLKLFFVSFATIERDPVCLAGGGGEDGGGGSNDGDHEDDDDLVVYSIDDVVSWDDFEVVTKLDRTDSTRCYIKASTLVELFAFVLAIADLRAFQDFHLYFANRLLNDSARKKYEKAAKSMVLSMVGSTWDNEKAIGFTEFDTAINNLYPNVLEPLGIVFDHLLYTSHGNDVRPDSLDKTLVANQATKDPHAPTKGGARSSSGPELEPTTTNVHSISQHTVLCQLSTFLGPEVFSMIKLYKGTEAGFSMRAFETKVFKWTAPTVLVVYGKKFGSKLTPSAKSFSEKVAGISTVHPRDDKRFTFGAYVESPWRSTSKDAFANEHTLLFELLPRHNLHQARLTKTKAYGYFSWNHGIGFGSLPPKGKKLLPGNVGMLLDTSLEFGVFRAAGLGGEFSMGMAGGTEYEDRFEVEDLEVWGLGKSEDLEAQRRRWEWEETEAERRKNVNIGDMREERVLLEMAGLVGKYGDFSKG